jgi:hypothetical protein
MSDNTVLPPGGGGDTVRTVDRGGVKTQVVALDVGGESGPENLGTQALPVDERQLALRFDNSASPVLYYGEAAPGSLTSAAAWRIQRIDTTTGVVVAWAGGAATFTQVWDNRAALAYS